MALKKTNARSLTSREITKIVAGTLGSLLTWCDVEEVIGAMDHFAERRVDYAAQWRVIQKMAPEQIDEFERKVRAATKD